MPPFYANALEAWHSICTIVTPNIQSVADPERPPIWNSTLLTPHISGHTLVFDEAWTTLNVFYVGDLVENGHWNHIEHFNTDRCTIPTIRRLAANLRTAEAFFRHHYPNLPLQINSLTSPSSFYAIKQPNGWLPSHTQKNDPQKIFPINLKRTRNCQWGMPLANKYTPNWGAVYLRPILSKDGDIAWRILHNRTVTPQLLHQLSKRDTDYYPSAQELQEP
jgi:hypothetical protein